MQQETLLKELMNRGFLIYERGSRFVLFKRPTPADIRGAICDEPRYATDEVTFDSYEEALKRATELISP